MFQRCRLRLALVGVVMLAAGIMAPQVPFGWMPSVVLAMAGLYLMAWATVGRGLWCRECKRFRIG